MEHLDALAGKRVFLTGGTGFIGSHLAARLAVLGARLFLLVRPVRAASPTPGRPEPPPGAHLLEGDLTDPASLEGALRTADPELVFHLAAFTDVRRDPSLAAKCRAVNYEGTVHLAKALKGCNVDRLIHFGTCEEYGDQPAPFTEDLFPKPVSPYSRSKARATLYLEGLGRKEGMPVVILRPFLTYGPGQDPRRFLSQAVAAALDDRPLPMTVGEQTREFNHISDMLEGILKAATVPGIEGEIINLACGEEHTILEVARTLYRLAGSKAQPEAGALAYRDGEIMRFFGNVDKCRRLLGYVPCKPFEAGLKELVDWHRRQRSGGCDDPEP